MCTYLLYTKEEKKVEDEGRKVCAPCKGCLMAMVSAAHSHITLCNTLQYTMSTHIAHTQRWITHESKICYTYYSQKWYTRITVCFSILTSWHPRILRFIAPRGYGPIVLPDDYRVNFLMVIAWLAFQFETWIIL